MEHTTVNRRYRVDRRIGEGGMAEVYLGHDLLLNRAVAIKVLRSQYASDPMFRARFEREAQAAAGFTHPNIIDIYDVGEEAGTPYIVMEYVRGETLKTIIEAEGPFDADDVASLLEQVGAALDYAHDRGLVHRDIKPQNILVDNQGLAKVVDFGIAKGLADNHLTEVGTGLGTVHYISPEQASGLMATPSSDIYALAVVAFEMLTKSLPFDADSAVGVAMRHVHDLPPAPSSIVPTVPANVDALVLRGLAKDPTARYASAGAFAEAMTNWRTFADASSTSPRSAASRTPVTDARLREPEARARPVPAGAPGDHRTSSSNTHGSGPTPSALAAGRRDDVGCMTWLVGATVVVALIAIVWLGFQFSPGLADLATEDTPTAVPAQVETTLPPLPTPTPAETPVPPTPTAEDQPPVVGVVPAPNLIGRTYDEAIDEATSVGLQVREGNQVFSEEVPAGNVAEQDPSAGAEIEQGSEMVIKLSRGSGIVDLSALGLVGQDVEAARLALQEAGLSVTEEPVASTDIPPGQVSGFQPAGSAMVGETVTLLVSQGDAVRVPEETVGQPRAAIAGQLEGLGLRVVEQVLADEAALEQVAGSSGVGIENGDVVGIVDEDGGDVLGQWLPRGSALRLIYYSAGTTDAGDDRRG